MGKLSKAEKAVIEYLIAGLSNKEIANKLFVQEKTIKFHNNNIFKKLGVKSRYEVIAKHNKLALPNERQKEHFNLMYKTLAEIALTDPNNYVEAKRFGIMARLVLKQIGKI